MHPLELLAYVVNERGIAFTAEGLNVTDRHLRRLRKGVHPLSPAQFWLLWQEYRAIKGFHVDVWFQVNTFEAYFDSFTAMS